MLQFVILSSPNKSPPELKLSTKKWILNVQLYVKPCSRKVSSSNSLFTNTLPTRICLLGLTYEDLATATGYSAARITESEPSFWWTLSSSSSMARTRSTRQCINLVSSIVCTNQDGSKKPTGEEFQALARALGIPNDVGLNLLCMVQEFVYAEPRHCDRVLTIQSNYHWISVIRSYYFALIWLKFNCIYSRHYFVLFLFLFPPSLTRVPLIEESPPSLWFPLSEADMTIHIEFIEIGFL